MMHPRKLARSIAHAQIDAAGYTDANRPIKINGSVFPSFFSRHWKEIATNAVTKSRKRRKRK